MNVLSLFDGISCGMLALENVGFKVDNYFASEIDEKAISCSKSNWYPDIQHIGDVRYVNDKSLPKIDLLMGGSPCQGFSFAGKKLNFEDERSKLFFEFVRVLNEVKPKYFLLENVKMKKEYQDIISKYMGVEPKLICSSNFSAQNRYRLYWTNIPNVESLKRTKEGELMSNILTSVNYMGVLDRFYLNEKQIERAKKKYKGKVWFSGNKMGNMVFPDIKERKAKTITATQIIGDRAVNHIQDSTGIRRLSIAECEQLQGLDVGYTAGYSDVDRYKMIGNGWQVDTIAHILSKIPKDEITA